MAFRIILVLLLLATGAVFIAFRFGLFDFTEPFTQPFTRLIRNPTKVSPTPPISITPSIESTTSARILLIEAPLVASPSQTFTIKWLIGNDKIAAVSSTAVRFGTNSQSTIKLPSDYPEKSAIFTGAIPATFSAQLSIATRGLYYYRAHALIDNINIWTEENTILIDNPATTSATPTP